jgi:hypothetical protein
MGRRYAADSKKQAQLSAQLLHKTATFCMRCADPQSTTRNIFRSAYFIKRFRNQCLRPLRQPIESAEYVLIKYAKRLADAGIEP